MEYVTAGPFLPSGVLPNRMRFGFATIRLFRTFGVVTTLSGGREVLPNRMRFGFATVRLFRIFVIGPIDIVNIWKGRTTR